MFSLFDPSITVIISLKKIPHPTPPIMVQLNVIYHCISFCGLRYSSITYIGILWLTRKWKSFANLFFRFPTLSPIPVSGPIKVTALSVLQHYTSKRCPITSLLLRQRETWLTSLLQTSSVRLCFLWLIKWVKLHSMHCSPQDAPRALHITYIWYGITEIATSSLAEIWYEM